MKTRTFAKAGILYWDSRFLLQQQYSNNIEFAMIWARKKLTKAAIPNPKALLDGKEHSFPIHLRSFSCKNKLPFWIAGLEIEAVSRVVSMCTLFLFISAATQKIKENKPRERETVMKKIGVNLNLGGFSMVRWGGCLYEENTQWLMNKFWKVLKEQKDEILFLELLA